MQIYYGLPNLRAIENQSQMHFWTFSRPEKLSSALKRLTCRGRERTLSTRSRSKLHPRKREARLYESQARPPERMRRTQNPKATTQAPDKVAKERDDGKQQSTGLLSQFAEKQQRYTGYRLKCKPLCLTSDRQNPERVFPSRAGVINIPLNARFRDHSSPFQPPPLLLQSARRPSS
jgi:hypothetical protein